MTGVQTCALPICFPVTIVTNQLIEETIKKTVNGKIDNLKKDLADYIKDDTAWKVKAAPALETYQDLQGFKKITKWLFGIVLAVGSLWTLIEKVK